MIDTDNAKTQARAQLDEILRLVRTYESIGDNPEDPDMADDARETARDALTDNALEVSVRSGWYTPGTAGGSGKPEEYRILLCTGGPAVRIIGDLGQYNELDCAVLQYQDWGTPWTTYPLDADEHAALLRYAAFHYFN